MNSEPSSTTAPSSICAKEAARTNLLLKESAAGAVSTDNPSTMAIAAAVVTALVAAGITRSTGDKGTKKQQ